MFKRLLIPLDGSQLAECTVPFGLTLQKAYSASVILQQVLESTARPTGQLDSLDWRLRREAARQYLERIARPFRSMEGDTEVEVEVTTGLAASEIGRVAKQSKADLVLLSTHGKGGLTAFGVSGTAHKVASASDVSVLIVRAATPSPRLEPALLERILVAVDGSPRGDWAAHVAASIAAPLGSELLLAHVVCRPDVLRANSLGADERAVLDRFLARESERARRHLDTVAASIGRADVSIRTRVEVGVNAARTLDDIAEEEHASLVVMGAHGRFADSGWQYGSVAATLIENGTKPLLILQDAPRKVRTPQGASGFSTSRHRAAYSWRP